MRVHSEDVLRKRDVLTLHRRVVMMSVRQQIQSQGSTGIGIIIDFSVQEDDTKLRPTECF